jgi:hypothetical protein
MTPHCPLLLALPPLSSAQWRCLRVLSEVADIAHAARKLHWSQALFRATLAELQACVGTQHIAQLGERVQLSQALQDLLLPQPPCRPENALAGAGAELPSSRTPPAPGIPAR